MLTTWNLATDFTFKCSKTCMQISHQYAYGINLIHQEKTL